MTTDLLPRIRFTADERAQVDAYVARRFPRGGVTVALVAEEDGDALHVAREAGGEAVLSFGLWRGRVHAVGPVGAGKVVAEAATMREVLGKLTGGCEPRDPRQEWRRAKVAAEVRLAEVLSI